MLTQCCPLVAKMRFVAETTVAKKLLKLGSVESALRMLKILERKLQMLEDRKWIERYKVPIAALVVAFLSVRQLLMLEDGQRQRWQRHECPVAELVVLILLVALLVDSAVGLIFVVAIICFPPSGLVFRWVILPPWMNTLFASRKIPPNPHHSNQDGSRKINNNWQPG